MRLIDADALHEKFFDMSKFKLNPPDMPRGATRRLIFHISDGLRLINDAPTIDAVPVVRCKDCKHWHNDGDAITWCNLSKWACGGNGFCLYAERKDNE